MNPLLPPNPNPNPNPSHKSLSSSLSSIRHLLNLSQTALSLFPITIPSVLCSDEAPYVHNSKLSPNRNAFHLDDLNGGDMCFSIDEYADFGHTFFYKDCPGVVTNLHSNDTPRTFTLPGILSIECANYSGGDNDKVIETTKFIRKQDIKFLPSELWFIRTEIEGWNEYPTSYSYGVLRAILFSLIVPENEILGWVIVNSPYYGIKIDIPLRDHIVLLFRLCVKTILREAVSWAEPVLIKDTEKLNPVAMSFNCPVLVEAIKWLSFQFSVLYGEVNGKCFAINMLKHWILDSSKNMSLFTVQKGDVSVEPLKVSVNGDENNVMEKCHIGESIFVSQVAAAVAALHERALLEEKLKESCDAKPIPSYQRVAEHAYISKRAEEERKKRSNYRPLLEHDGIFWHRSNDQEGNTTKTREELLAEQRDYKRRRMSYRGKKLKRNATEVTRDIIEDCMDSIKQAGGIGCLAKVSDEAGKLFSEPPRLGVKSADFGGSKKYVSTPSTVTSDHFDGKKEHSRRHEDTKYTRDKPVDDRKQRSRDSSRNYEHHNDRRTTDSDRHRHGREYYSRSLERERSHETGHRDDLGVSKRKNSRVFDYGDNPSYDRTSYQRDRGDRDSEQKDRKRKHSKRDHREDSVTSSVISDRYDPYESRDMYEE